MIRVLSSLPPRVMSKKTTGLGFCELLEGGRSIVGVLTRICMTDSKDRSMPCFDTAVQAPRGRESCWLHSEGLQGKVYCAVGSTESVPALVPSLFDPDTARLLALHRPLTPSGMGTHKPGWFGSRCFSIMSASRMKRRTRQTPSSIRDPCELRS